MGVFEIVQQPHGDKVIEDTRNTAALTFYNDPPHRSRFDIIVRVESVSVSVAFSVRLVYENGNDIVTRNPTESILIASLSNPSRIQVGTNVNLKFGITDVGMRHQGQKVSERLRLIDQHYQAHITINFQLLPRSLHELKQFKLVFECDGCSPVESAALLVKSKNPVLTRKRERLINQIKADVQEHAVKRTKSECTRTKV
jgi:hypothetical protein